MKFKAFITLSIVSLAAFTASNLLSSRLPISWPYEAVQGKKVWQAYNCNSCHAIFGDGGYNAEDLTHIAQKRDSKQLLNFLVSPAVMRPNKQKLHPGLTTQEAEYITAYFQALDRIPTLGWPPGDYTAGGAE